MIVLKKVWLSLLVCGVVITWKSKIVWWSGFGNELSQSLFETDGKCEWNVNGFDFDISSLEGQTLSYNDTSIGFLYSYTPCENDLDCGSGERDYMVLQTKADNCHELCRWNESVVPKYDSSDGSYNLHYTGGQSGRNFIAKYVCGSMPYNVHNSGSSDLGKIPGILIFGQMDRNCFLTLCCCCILL